MNSFRFQNHHRAFFFVTCVSTLTFGWLGDDRCSGFVLADEAVQSEPAQAPPDAAAEDKGGRKIPPEQFHVVDDTVKLTVLLVVVSSLGTIVILTLIVMGARRMRRLTRSPLLKSKYDELELLREKYRREVEGLDTPPSPSRETRR